MSKNFDELKGQLTKLTDVSITNVEILKTSNYKLFAFDKGLNREPTHYKSIKASIVNNDLTQFNPILVYFNEDGLLIIIDGQNRFMACKDLRLPIYFIVAENADISDAPQLNSASKNWTSADYVKHFANKGYENYITLLHLHRKYGISLTALIRVLCSTGKPDAVIKDGTFKINSNKDPYEFCEHWCEFCEYIGFADKKMFVEALGTVFYKPYYDPQRMLEKLHVCSGIVHDQPRRILLRGELNKVYNYNVGVKNRVNFED